MTSSSVTKRARSSPKKRRNKVADVMPDYHLEIQKLRTGIASLRHNTERFRLEVMEVASRKKKALENLAATEVAIEEHEQRLAGLIETHGEPEPVEEMKNG